MLGGQLKKHRSNVLNLGGSRRLSNCFPKRRLFATLLARVSGREGGMGETFAISHPHHREGRRSGGGKFKAIEASLPSPPSAASVTASAILSWSSLSQVLGL